jgi:type I restriction enzyme, S subunit
MSDVTVHALGDLADVQTGPFGSQLHSSDYVDEGTPIITVEHLAADSRISHDRIPRVSVSDTARLARYSLQLGDLVFSRVGAIDRCSYVSPREDGWLFSGRLLRVRPNPSLVSSRFLTALLSHESSRSWIKSHAVGSTMLCLNTSILEHVPIRLPQLSEQRRIANILDTVDEAIRSTERLIVKLEQAKLGLLYDLLTRGVDTFGHLRDPHCSRNEFRPSASGSNPSMWSIRALGDLVDGLRPIVYGILMPGKGERDGVPVVKVKDISNGGIRMDDLLLTSRSIDEQYRRSRIQPGDLLFTIRGTVGRMAFVPPNLANANITQDTARISITGADKRFVWYYLQMPAAKTFIDLHTLGQAVKGINLRDVRRVPVALPSRDEQEFIVESLDAATKRIRNELELAEALRLIRRGLADDLLTGRVRVGISA